jgi:uncharacterized heparinase superfamily protein
MTIKVIVLAGQTFRGVTYFGDAAFEMSDNYARYVVGTGVARFALPFVYVDSSTATIADLRAFVLEQVGHTEVFDDCVDDDARRDFVESLVWEINRTST